MATGIEVQKKRVQFMLNAPPGREVYVAGSFNNWSASATRMKAREGNGTYAATLILPKGAHQYKFVVDGRWLADPKNPQSAPNGMGSHNSVIQV
jgi:1,4-alpha-glucan branching enzyme